MTMVLHVIVIPLSQNGRDNHPLLDFLLKITEQLGGEKLRNGDLHAVAELLQCRKRDAVVPAAHEVVHGGLRNAADYTEPVDRQPFFAAQLQDPSLDCFSDGHGLHLFSSRGYPFGLEKINPIELL